MTSILSTRVFAGIPAVSMFNHFFNAKIFDRNIFKGIEYLGEEVFTKEQTPSTSEFGA